MILFLCVDLQMPVMGGCEAVRQLRLHEMETGVPEPRRQRVIGISANSEEAVHSEALACGMHAFVPVSQAGRQAVWERADGIGGEGGACICMYVCMYVCMYDMVSYGHM